MALTGGTSTRRATGTPGAKPYSNDIQLRIASVTILSRYGTSRAPPFIRSSREAMSLTAQGPARSAVAATRTFRDAIERSSRHLPDFDGFALPRSGRASCAAASRTGRFGRVQVAQERGRGR